MRKLFLIFLFLGSIEIASAHDIVNDVDFNLENGVYVTVKTPLNFTQINIYNSTNSPSNIIKFQINSSFFYYNSSANSTISNISLTTTGLNFTVNMTTGIFNISLLQNNNGNYTFYVDNVNNGGKIANSTGWVDFNYSDWTQNQHDFSIVYTAASTGGSAPGGGGGGGVIIVAPNPTPAPSPDTETSPSPIIFIPIPGGEKISIPNPIEFFDEIEKNSEEVLRDVLKCSKDDLLFNSKCGKASTQIYNPANWWILLIAFLTAFAIIAIKGRSNLLSYIVDTTLYGFSTIIIVQIIALLGGNSFFLVYLLNNAMPRYIALSYAIMAIIVTLSLDAYINKRNRFWNRTSSISSSTVSLFIISSLFFIVILYEVIL